MPLNQQEAHEKAVGIGISRELPVDQSLIWPRIAPLQSIDTDKFTFEVEVDSSDLMAPAADESAESETYENDTFFGEGKGSVIDWRVSTRTKPSDITNARAFDEAMRLFSEAGIVPPRLFQNQAAQLSDKLAKDRIERRRQIDFRLEWLVTQALSTGGINYADGKIRFETPFGLPVDQLNQAPASGNLWNVGVDHDPIGDIDAMQEFMYARYDITLDTMVISPESLRKMARSKYFYPRTGLAIPAGIGPRDMSYINPNFGQEEAVRIISQATGITNIIVYDAKRKVKPLGANTRPVPVRFMDEGQVIFFPSVEAAGGLLSTDLGFAKTLTSPHPEGDWASGIYTFEDSGVDPWGRKDGTGIKAMPVFPRIDLSYSMQVL